MSEQSQPSSQVLATEIPVPRVDAFTGVGVLQGFELEPLELEPEPVTGLEQEIPI